MEAATGSTEKYWGQGEGEELLRGELSPAQPSCSPFAGDDLTGKVKLSWGRFYRWVGEVTAGGDPGHKKGVWGGKGRKRKENKEFEGKHSLPGWPLGAASPSGLSPQQPQSRGR